MKKLAILAASGTTNAMAQLMNLVMAAVASQIAVRVFFRDAAVLKLTKDGAATMNLSAEWQPRAAAITAQLKAHKLDNLPALIRDVKSLGDAKFYACSSSLSLAGLDAKQLLPEIDAVRGLTSFLLEEMATADQVMSC